MTGKMKANEGEILTFVGHDDWSRTLFEREDGEVLVDVDGILHTATPDWEEPCCSTGLKTPDGFEFGVAKPRDLHPLLGEAIYVESSNKQKGK